MALHVLDEANRCLGCKKPMCQQGCPIHTNIPEVIRLLKANQLDDAGRMLFENNPLFPQRVNAEFVRVVDRNTLKMRVWERGNGETRACGTGACAAVVAATENGLCPKGEPITVKVSGGDLIVTYDDDGVRLTGNAELAFTGVTTY